MEDMNLLNELDFDNIELGGITTDVQEEVVEEEVVEEKPVKSKKKKLKEETKDVIEKHAETVESMKAEEEKKAEKKAESPKNVIYIDAQNADDRMKVADYMKQGRLIFTDKNRPVILAEQKTQIHSSSKPPIHTIMCDEIVHVTIRKYYLDLETMPVGKRTIAKQVIWVYHKGYQSLSMITEEQLKYLLSKKFISQKDIYYVHHDISEGTSYFLGFDSKEPDTNRLAKIKASEQKNYNIQTGKLIVPETEVTIEDTTEDIVEVEENIKDAV